MQSVYDFLKQAKTYYLATVEGSRPHVRPFGTIALFEGKLYILTGRKKECSKQMHINPQVEICALLDRKWLRISATAISDTNIDAERHMLAAYPELSRMYKVGDGNTEVFYLKNATATFYSFVEEPKVIKF